MAVVIGVNIELEMYTFDSWSYNFSARNPLRDYNLLECVLKRTEADFGTNATSEYVEMLKEESFERN